jgi:hypothetical protein
VTTPSEHLRRRAELVEQFRDEADRLELSAKHLRDDDDLAAAQAFELVAGDYRRAADALEYGSAPLTWLEGERSS